ncbi:hypothetical protein [Reyranella massiliensis]|uniref:hypothetical protein n=1 Tax=Reyranella massiliensis TaxID=445220 RepID=UPI0005C29CAB|nr:hypothetical protein [Reyranella massiliensis]
MQGEATDLLSCRFEDGSKVFPDQRHSLWIAAVVNGDHLKAILALVQTELNGHVNSTVSIVDEPSDLGKDPLNLLAHGLGFVLVNFPSNGAEAGSLLGIAINGVPSCPSAMGRMCRYQIGEQLPEVLVQSRPSYD